MLFINNNYNQEDRKILNKIIFIGIAIIATFIIIGIVLIFFSKSSQYEDIGIINSEYDPASGETIEYSNYQKEDNVESYGTVMYLGTVELRDAKISEIDYQYLQDAIKSYTDEYLDAELFRVSILKGSVIKSPDSLDSSFTIVLNKDQVSLDIKIVHGISAHDPYITGIYFYQNNNLIYTYSD